MEVVLRADYFQFFFEIRSRALTIQL